ncbi:MAG: DNA internalization-related competence protein ComEC/Rec2 [Zetaproteobacteria bacterium]|nr:MAG: DNA internalization-related competence protein ComEC/Rec2 [Zetaproteobacteria bacterium]
MAGLSTPIESFPLRAVPSLPPAVLWIVALALTRTDLVPLTWAALIIPLIVLLLLWRRRTGLLLVFVIGVLFGMGSLMRDAWTVSVDDRWVTGDVQVEATLQALRRYGQRYRLLLADVRDTEGNTLRGMVTAFYYGGRVNALPGQRVAMTLRLHRPHNARNPGAFDYRSWCFDHHVALIGYVRGRLRVVGHGSTMMAVARQRVRQALEGVPTSERAVLQALLLADRGHISARLRALFSATGTAHLLAISGLHMGLVAGFIAACCWWLLTRREAWIVRLPVRLLALLLGALVAGIYGSIAGWPVPAMRAFLMLLAGVLAWCWRAHAHSVHLLLLALMAILLLDPAAVGSLSLWLSFLATAAILLLAPSGSTARSWRKRLLAMVLVSMLTTLATLPWVVSAFGYLPVYAPLTNLLLVPLYALWVLPTALLGELLALLGMSGGAQGCMGLAGMGVETGLAVLQWFQQLPLGRLVLARPTWAMQACFLLGMGVSGWLAWRGGARRAALTALMTLFVYAGVLALPRHPASPQWMVWDVGQGAASTLLTTDGHVMVIDVPGRPGSRYNGGTTVAQGLRALGWRKVDVVLISHAQADHAGGVGALLAAMGGARELWLPDVPATPSMQRLLALARAQDLRVRRLARGDWLRWHGLDVRVLWPPKGDARWHGNNRSLVLAVRWPDGTRLLLPGDIERAAEVRIVRAGLEPVEAMLMPHHGSRTSSTEAFVRATHPRLAIAQTGRHNPYGFPAKEVVSRYRRLGTRVLNTAEGAMLLTRDGDAQWRVQRWTEAFSPRRALALQWSRRLL